MNRELKNLTIEPPDGVGPLDLLAIAVRPSEAELACGGTLRKAAAAGKRVAVLDLTDGETIATAGNLLSESLAAGEILGLVWRGNRFYPDGRLDNAITIRMTLASDLRRLRPAAVVIPHRDAADPEQRLACSIVEHALHLASVGNVDDITEPHPAPVVYWPAAAFERPSVVVDVTAHFPEARRALAAYGTLAGIERLDGVLERQQATARFQGLQAGVPYAEAFLTRSPLRSDLLA